VRGRGRPSGLPPRFNAELFGHESFQRADRDAFIDTAAAAFDLARRAADAAADRGERVWLACDAVGVEIASFAEGDNLAARVGTRGTAPLALDLALPVVQIGEFYTETLSRHNVRKM
jgi:hypothetical protein